MTLCLRNFCSVIKQRLAIGDGDNSLVPSDLPDIIQLVSSEKRRVKESHNQCLVPPAKTPSMQIHAHSFRA
jgi:hypothetical protein